MMERERLCRERVGCPNTSTGNADRTYSKVLLLTNEDGLDQMETFFSLRFRLGEAQDIVGE